MMIVIIVLVFIVLLNIALWFLFLPYIVHNKIDHFQSDLVDKHYEEVENMYHTMRAWKHNYHNHIQTIEALLELERKDDLKQYLTDMKSDMVTMEVILKTGNIKADAILNSKIALMKSYGIKVDATAIVPENIPIKGTELSVFIGNILDNAVEACLKIEEVSERFVHIYIDILKGQFYLSVTNSMVGKATRSGNNYLTTKSGHHGFGLWSVDQIVKKYNGIINRQSEEGVFATEVLLPIERNSEN